MNSLGARLKGRVATARVPFGEYASDVILKLEGNKRRRGDGKLSFSDSHFNLELISKSFPGLAIDVPSPLNRKDYRKDVPLGEFSEFGASYAHQMRAFDLCKDAEYFGLVMEQGTGKTRVAINKAARHYCRGEITGLIVVTFKGIHAQWVDQQLPAHMGCIDGKQIQYIAQAWEGEHLYWRKDGPNRFEIMTLNYETLGTKKGETCVSEFVDRHPGSLMAVIDESHGIKSYDSVRTKNCLDLAKFSRYRLIMSGTPITKHLEDEWSQSNFLSESIFGMRYVTSFRTIYTDSDGKDRNVEQFKRIIAPHIFRVTKDECLDLPPKIRERYCFDLNAKSRKAYDEIKKNFLTKIDGQKITVQNAAVLLLRLQQIAGGILIGEDKEVIHLGDERKHALTALLQKYEDETKVLIFARFKRDIVTIAEVCKSFGKAVYLHGDIKAPDREAAYQSFMTDPSVKFMIANPAVGGTGYNMQGECRTCIYYSNSFNSVERWQSEDRLHRIGTIHPVTYTDIIANNTIDEGILGSLNNKKAFADLVLGALEELGIDPDILVSPEGDFSFDNYS